MRRFVSYFASLTPLRSLARRRARTATGTATASRSLAHRIRSQHVRLRSPWRRARPILRGHSLVRIAELPEYRRLGQRLWPRLLIQPQAPLLPLQFVRLVLVVVVVVVVVSILVHVLIALADATGIGDEIDDEWQRLCCGRCWWWWWLMMFWWRRCWCSYWLWLWC